MRGYGKQFCQFLKILANARSLAVNSEICARILFSCHSFLCNANVGKASIHDHKLVVD